jgi:polar amino acid transport system substrate-binding protein
VLWATTILSLPALSRSAAHAGEQTAPGLDRVRTAGVLRWGGDQQGGEPYVYEDPHQPGHLIGFEVDLADAIARYLGVSARFVQNDWTTLIPSLERETFDIALNGIEVTPALASRVAFSRPYYFFAERLVAHADDPRITNLDSLRGRRVGTLAGTQAWHTLIAAGARAVPYEGVEEPIIDLEHRRTDAVLLDDIIVDRYAPQHHGVRVVGDIGRGRYAIALRPADAGLLVSVNAALTALINTGELRRIRARWKLDNTNQVGLSQSPSLSIPAAPTAASPSEPAPHFGWHHFLLFLQGALVTVFVSVGAMALAIPFGLALALIRLYRPRARWLATAYVELFRGTPVLLQLYVLYYGLAPYLRLDPFGAAIIGLGLNYAAYEAELYRAGILAVPSGQMDAALGLGMTRAMALRRVVLPQAFRIALPGVTNDFIALLKDSSLVSVITVVELTKRMSITAVDTRGWLMPGLACAALYFAISYPLSRLARHFEQHLARR